MLFFFQLAPLPCPINFTFLYLTCNPSAPLSIAAVITALSPSSGLSLPDFKLSANLCQLYGSVTARLSFRLRNSSFAFVFCTVSPTAFSALRLCYSSAFIPPSPASVLPPDPSVLPPDLSIFLRSTGPQHNCP